MKKPPLKVAHNLPRPFFQYCQLAQIKPKYQFSFHKNLQPRDFSRMTLAVIHNLWMIFVSTDHSTALNSPSVRIFVSVQEKEIDESNIQQEPFIKFLQIPVVSDISFQQVFTGFMLHQHMIICTYALALFWFFCCC